MLVHVSAPALGLAAAQWAVVSWGESQVMRESITDAKYIYRYISWHSCILCMCRDGACSKRQDWVDTLVRAGQCDYASL